GSIVIGAEGRQVRSEMSVGNRRTNSTQRDRGPFGSLLVCSLFEPNQVPLDRVDGCHSATRSKKSFYKHQNGPTNAKYPPSRSVSRAEFSGSMLSFSLLF